MLALPDDERQQYSFLCQGQGLVHHPLAMATVDPAVVDLDFNNAPPDRFHGVVDMVDDLLAVVRKGLKKDELAEVCTANHVPCMGAPAQRVAYASQLKQHMRSICEPDPGPQVLKRRFREAPRCDVYDKLKAGIFNIRRVCAWG